MKAATVCRVCLVGNLNLYGVPNNLQNAYERITRKKYNKVGYPVSMCYICLSVLRKCHKFMETARENNKLLKHWHDYSQQSERRLAKPLSIYSVTKVELVSMGNSEVPLKHEIKVESVNVKCEEIEASENNLMDNADIYLQHDIKMEEMDLKPDFIEYNTDVNSEKMDLDEQKNKSNLLLDSPTVSTFMNTIQVFGNRQTDLSLASNMDVYTKNELRNEIIKPQNNEMSSLRIGISDIVPCPGCEYAEASCDDDIRAPNTINEEQYPEKISLMQYPENNNLEKVKLLSEVQKSSPDNLQNITGLTTLLNLSDLSENQCFSLGSFNLTELSTDERNVSPKDPQENSNHNPEIQKKSRSWDRRNACVYCDQLVTNFSRHLLRNHSNEHEVLQYMSINDSDAQIRKKKRQKITDELRNRGNFKHNSAVAFDKNGILLPRKRNKQIQSPSNYVNCKNCLGTYKRASFYRHFKKCFDYKSNTNQHSLQGAIRILTDYEETDISDFELEKKNENLSSAASEDEKEDNTKPKRRKIAHTKWTNEEIKLVQKHFKENIEKKRNPGKAKCETVLQMEPILRNRTWMQLNTYVNNIYKKSRLKSTIKK